MEQSRQISFRASGELLNSRHEYLVFGNHIVAGNARAVITRTHSIELAEITLPREEHEFCFNPVVISCLCALGSTDVIAYLPCSP